MQNCTSEEDGDHGIQRGQDRDDADEAVLGSGREEDVAPGVEDADRRERRQVGPSRARRATDRFRMSSPFSVTVPEASGVKPVTASMSVVLPAPFGPIRPVIRPGLTSSETSSTATTAP